MFLGLIGVGKMELVKVLVVVMFGFEDNMIWIDMFEYMECYLISCLIGLVFGYVGYDEGGQLIEKVCQKLYLVVLFDEVEKVYLDVFNILL